MTAQACLDFDAALRGQKVIVPEPVAHFNGPVYEPQYDHARLSGQILRVAECMRDGRWRTLAEIAVITGDPPASISAQLRHLRKPRFGSHYVEKRARGDRSLGLWEYQLRLTDK